MAFLLQMSGTVVSKTDGGSRRTKREMNFVICTVFKELCDPESFNLRVHLFIQFKIECFACSSPKLFILA